jgi:hypothetical protein
MNKERWDFWAKVFLVAVVVCLIPTWPKLPVFMDAYYHLSAMQGFADAGGWTGWSFWEAAPSGRPQLYPPLFHVLGMFLFIFKVSPILIARLFDFSIYPLFLAFFWRWSRSLFGSRVAFFFLLLLGSSSPLYLHIVNNIPFALALILGCWAYERLSAGRFFSAWVGAVLMIHTHLWMAFIMGIVVCIMMFFWTPELRRRAAGVWGLALVASFPWFFHVARYAAYFHYVRVLEFFYANIGLVAMVLGLIGLVFSWKGPTHRRFVVFWAVAMGTLFVTHRDRFLSGTGQVPFLLLASFVMDRLWMSSGRREEAGRAGVIFLFVVFYAASPVLSWAPGGARPHIRISSLLFSDPTVPGSVKGETIYFPKYVNEITRWIDRNTSPHDILASNYDYAGGMVALLSRRAMANIMMQEVRPQGAGSDLLGNAQWVVWFKEAEGKTDPFLDVLTGPGRYALAYETPIVRILKAPFQAPASRGVRSTFPAWAIFLILLALGVGVARDSLNK